MTEAQVYPVLKPVTYWECDYPFLNRYLLRIWDQTDLSWQTLKLQFEVSVTYWRCLSWIPKLTSCVGSLCLIGPLDVVIFIIIHIVHSVATSSELLPLWSMFDDQETQNCPQLDKTYRILAHCLLYHGDVINLISHHPRPRKSSLEDPKRAVSDASTNQAQTVHKSAAITSSLANTMARSNIINKAKMDLAHPLLLFISLQSLWIFFCGCLGMVIICRLVWVCMETSLYIYLYIYYILLVGN